MRQVGDRAQDARRLSAVNASSSACSGRRLLAQLAAFVLAGFALGGVLGLADRLADLVGLAVQVVDFGLLGLALGLNGDELIDVSMGAALQAVLAAPVRRFRG